jgi:hypothetical protein
MRQKSTKCRNSCIYQNTENAETGYLMDRIALPRLLVSFTTTLTFDLDQGQIYMNQHYLVIYEDIDTVKDVSGRSPLRTLENVVSQFVTLTGELRSRSCFICALEC